jgi:hypothetical protein
LRNYLRDPNRYPVRQPSVRRQRRAVLTLIAIFAVIALLVLIVSSVRRRSSSGNGGGHYSVVSVNPPVTNEQVITAEPPAPTLEATEEPTEAPTPTPAPTSTTTQKPDMTTTLRPGDSGDAVAQMQRRLIELGYLDGEADGKYGNGTKKAVKAFQKKNKLTADGIAGKNTLTALYSDDAVKK